MLDWISNPQAWIALVTLTILEIVLGIDNIIFISILAGKLKTPEEQEKARKVGLSLALITRILLLLSISWVANAKNTLFTLPIPGLSEDVVAISWRDIILFGGGLFLIYKSVKEIHAKLEGHEHSKDGSAVAPAFSAIIGQILILDVVFSLDSVITAVGMANDVPVMILAVVIAVGFMFFSSGAIAGFVNKHPTVTMLALSFLLLIGVNLVAEGAGQHIPKGYVYFAMAFSVMVEMLNLRLDRRRKTHAVHLKEQVGLPHIEK